MAKKKEIIEKPADFGDFLLYNHEKLGRVIDGSVGKGGAMLGGLGKDAQPEDILAEYDKLGGLVMTMDGRKVETGTFYDFENKVPRKNISLKYAKESNKAGIKITTEEVGDKEPKKKIKKSEEDEE